MRVCGLRRRRSNLTRRPISSAIIDTLGEYMWRHWPPGNFQRGGNTKTHGVVRASFTVRDDLPPQYRRGLFAEPKTYPAWVRFSGPGPDWPRDIDDVGFVSCSIKVMGVPGPKLLDDEKLTQDFLSITSWTDSCSHCGTRLRATPWASAIGAACLICSARDRR